MKKIRIPLLVCTGIMLICLVLGSLFDLQIAKAIYSERNGFGVFMAAFGLIPGYAIFPIIGGLLFANTFKSIKPKWLRIILYIVSALALLVPTYLCSKDMFSLNGFNKAGIGYSILAIGINLIFHSGFWYLGYYLFKDYKNDKIWIAMLILMVAIIIALVPGVTLIKVIVNRPRYRLIVTDFYDLRFYNWFERCTNYKGYIALGADKEDFKSFPSGHAGTSLVLAVTLSMVIPLAKPKLQKYSIILFFAGFAYCLLVSFSRMLVGAHFLSDVSIGALLVLVFTYLSNEIIIHYNFFKLE